MPRDTRWRWLLCWGTVLTFLSLPLFILGIALLHPEMTAQIREFKFLPKFFESITALVFGLAGLRSVDKFIEAKNGNGNGKSFPKPKNPES